MPSTRARISAAYFAVILTVAALFSAAVWIASSAASDSRVAEVLRRQGLIEMRADTAIGVLRSYIRAGAGDGVLQMRPYFHLIVAADNPDTVRFGTDSVVQLAEGVRDWYKNNRLASMAGLPDFLVVFGQDAAPLFVSQDLRKLWEGDSLNPTPPILSSLARIPPNGGHTLLTYRGHRLIFYSAAEPSGATRISHAVAGTVLPPASSAAPQIAWTLVLVSPLIILFTVWAGYAIAGRPLRPINAIINEVERITDGRSLHRRLAVDTATGTELSRLTSTLNEMMARLETSFNALRRFTADASHELNTPLTVLRADIERAMHAPPRSPDQMVALEEALREIRRMSDLVDSLLTLARADEGRFDLHREPVQLAPLVQEVYETALLLGEDAEVNVRLVILEDATVMGDRDRLRQLFMNLVTNAIKYTPKGGRVDLSLSVRLDGIAFSVRDTGIGISAVDLENVFERFWRADRSRSRAAVRGGFGLGLPISQWIAHAHGGTLTARSKLGKGSVFSVLLPGVETDHVVAPERLVAEGEPE